MADAEKVLKWLIVIACIVMMLFLRVYPRSDCGDCLFNIDGDDLMINQFMNVYDDYCFEPQEINLSSINITSPPPY